MDADAATVVFLHAHPDDEAIFTGGTMAMLAARGHRVVLVVATSGELGVAGDGAAIGSELARARQRESRECCEALGVGDVVFLDYEDSGVDGENVSGFCHEPQLHVAERLGAVLAQFGSVDALVSYDDHGIYGHPDHEQVHRVARLAVQQAGIPTLYESTVDREYLHFVETHVVVEAGLGERPMGRGLAASALGLATVEIDCTVDVHSVLETKRAAMAAHATQLPADAPAFALGEQNFAAVYGFEWYVRRGPSGAIDELPLA